MGIDINAYVEFKPFSESKEYGCWAQLHLNRESTLFAFMVKMDSDDNPIRDIRAVARPKGLPKDISFLVKEAYENFDKTYHTSWLRLDEIEEVRERYLKWNLLQGFKVNWTQVDPIITLLKSLNQFPPPINKSRLVFWFDY